MESPVERGEETTKQVSDAYYVKLALRIAADFGASIAIPAVLAAILGSHLDQRWGTSPWMLIICLVIAFGLTAVWLVKKAKKYQKLYTKQ